MRRLWLACSCLVLSACATDARPQQDAWQPLFDTAATHGWHNVGSNTLDPRWQLQDGAMVLTAPGVGDIASDATYAYFELELDWQVAPGGNSGLFYRAGDVAPIWQRAPEYQLLDDTAAEDRFDPKHRAGAIYDLVAPQGIRPQPGGIYRHARIVACGAHVEHWLDGVKVAAYDLDSADWRARVAASKFAGEPDFARARTGRIGLQDHGAEVRIRNARIRAMPGCR